MISISKLSGLNIIFTVQFSCHVFMYTNGMFEEHPCRNMEQSQIERMDPFAEALTSSKGIFGCRLF